jgi:hypothetical protein
VETKETASQVRDKLTSFLDINDKLFVGKIQTPAAWRGLGDEVSQWISSHLR